MTEETTVTKRHQLNTKTLTSPPLPALPFDLIAEILYRVPEVKTLIQLGCICKSWKSLISHPEFAKKHLRFSTNNRHHLIVSSCNSQGLFLFDSPISSVFSTTSTFVTQTQLNYPDCLKFCSAVSSCDGIFCFTRINLPAVLWNPSIGKFNILPPLSNASLITLYSFGYDHFIDNYKVIVVSPCINKNEVNVYTLGTDSWRRIQDFPYSIPDFRTGIFVSGTVNWLSYDMSVIVSLDLEKESYQKLYKPGLKKDRCVLGLLKDCLCMLANSDMFMDVWVMKEYGNKESWIKLYIVPYMGDHQGAYTKVYVSEDDQMLMDFNEFRSGKKKLVVYNSKNGTLKKLKIQNIDSFRWIDPGVYKESLISPCS